MPGIYFDESATLRAVSDAMRSYTTVELAIDHLPGATDDEQLARATSLGLVIYTFDLDDFPRIHDEWIRAQRPHAGIIANPHQRMPIGDQLRQLRSLLPRVESEGLRNTLIYLSSWRRG